MDKDRSKSTGEPIKRTAEGPPLDLRKIVRTLNKFNVRYVFVGGISATLRGAERQTFDVDCVVSRDRENLANLALALSELGARFRVARVSDEESKSWGVKLNADTFVNAGNSTWRTDAGDIDILADLKDRAGRSVPYGELETRSEILTTDGLQVVLAALSDVIAAKTFANRPKDLDALPELMRIENDARFSSERDRDL